MLSQTTNVNKDLDAIKRWKIFPGFLCWKTTNRRPSTL